MGSALEEREGSDEMLCPPAGRGHGARERRRRLWIHKIKLLLFSTLALQLITQKLQSELLM